MDRCAKNIVFAFVGNYIGGGIFVGLVYAYLNGKRQYKSIVRRSKSGNIERHFRSFNPTY